MYILRKHKEKSWTHGSSVGLSVHRLWARPAIKGTSVLCPPRPAPRAPLPAFCPPRPIIQAQTPHFFFSPHAQPPWSSAPPGSTYHVQTRVQLPPPVQPQDPRRPISRFPLSPVSPTAPPGLLSDMGASWARPALAPSVSPPGPAPRQAAHGTAGHPITWSALTRLESSCVQQGLGLLVSAPAPEPGGVRGQSGYSGNGRTVSSRVQLWKAPSRAGVSLLCPEDPPQPSPRGPQWALGTCPWPALQ